MTNQDKLTSKSKELAFLLRHDKSYNFDKDGFRTVSDLIDNHRFTQDMLEKIVATDNKSRYEFNDDHTLIRACQGHSVSVDLGLEEIPYENIPEFLYHGTSVRFLDSILTDGLSKMTRNHVHLSFNIETAYQVGRRHGKPIILYIDAKRMSRDGHRFYLSNNNVPLTDFVDPKYIICYAGTSNSTEKEISIVISK